MPFYRRGYYRRGRSGYGYRGYNRSWRRRGWYRRGLARSSTQGNRRFSVIVPTQASFNFTVSGTSYWSDLHAVSPYDASISGPHVSLRHCALPSSLMYRTYTRLYDQVKVDWVSVRISIMSLVGSGGITPAVKVVTMWDRAATSGDVTNGASVPSPDSIQNGSESQVSLIVNNSRAIVNRFNVASDIQERTVFHDCAVANNNGSYVDSEFNIGHNVGYAPVLYMALNTATSPGSGTSFTFTCSLDVKWRVTFRNPKFGLSASSSGSKGVDDLTSDIETLRAEAVKSEGAGKSVPRTLGVNQSTGSVEYAGLLGDVVDRLKLNMHTDGVYEDCEYDHDEDVQFAYEKLGDEVFHQLFKNVYDDDLKKFSLIVDKKDGDVLIKEA